MIKKKRIAVPLDLEPHSFVGTCLDTKSNADNVLHRVKYTVNNVDRHHTLIATDPMDAINKTQAYLKGETK
jgi:hypothetical protein